MRLAGRGLRQAPVSALLAAGLRCRLPDQRHGQDQERTGDLAPRSMHGLSLLHDLVPLRHPEVRVRQWNPKIQKCNLCFERLQQGQKPACVECLPHRRAGLRQQARPDGDRPVRIYNHPDRYVHRSTASTKSGARAGSTSLPCPSRRSAFAPISARHPIRSSPATFSTGCPWCFSAFPLFFWVFT